MANANFIVQNGITLGGQGGGSISTDPTTGALVIAPAPTAGNANPVAVVISTSGTVSTVATTNGVANAANVATVANIASQSSLTTLANVTITGNLLVQGVATYTSTETVLGVEIVAGNLVANSGTASSSTSAGALVVAGGAGISGDLFVGGNVHTTGTSYLKIPSGTTAQRPGSANVALGMIRYNSTISSFEGYGAGSAWSSLGGVKSVDGFATITAEASAGAGDDVLRFYSGSTGSSVQVAWASASNISILPTTVSTSSTTGALQVAGGAGVAGALFVGGGINGTLSTASQPNVTTLSGVTSIGASSSTTITGTLQTTSQAVVNTMAGLTSFGTSGINTTAQGNLTVAGNLVVNGNITTTGNVTNVTITGNSGQFFGNASGFNAMYMGIPSGYFIEPQMVAQVSSNFNGYAGFNLQNINNGSLASTDIFLTPNNGTIADGFFDIGVASSTYNYSGYGLLNPNDMYLIASGNVATGNGNLVVSTSNANDIVFAVQGTNANNEVMRITRANVVAIKSTVSSSSTTTGALTVAGGVGVAGTVSASTVSATTLTGTLSTAAQTNVTSVGTLTGLTVSSTIAASTNNNINIGSSGSVFATVYATTFSGVSTTAKYADLAENYQADKSYAPGTVVMFGGTQEVTLADADTTQVAGVVSTNPAHLMNGGLTGSNVVPLALQGRVPCNVIGPVKKGDMMVSAGFGFAKASSDPKVGTVIGKSLSDFTGAKGQIEVVVGRV